MLESGRGQSLSEDKRRTEHGNTSILRYEEKTLGSDCRSVGRVVASDTRGPFFKSMHHQNFTMNKFAVNCCKGEIKNKEAGKGPFLKKIRKRNLTKL